MSHNTIIDDHIAENLSPDLPRDTSRDLQFSPAFTLDPDLLERVTGEIESDLRSGRKRARKSTDHEAHVRRVGAVFANGLEGARLCRSVFYPRGTGAYRGDTPGWFTERAHPKLITSLERAGYLEGEKGMPDKRGGLQSTYRLSDKGLLLCSEVGLHASHICVVQQDHRALVLKDHSKQLILPDYPDANVAMKRSNADAINDFLGAFDITYIDEKGVLQRPPKAMMTRIYNECSMVRGGRFFRAFWHLLEKELRATIRIDGTPTGERDFSSMFPRMAYHKLDIKAPADCYTINEFAEAAELQGLEYKPIRNKTKKLLNMDMNAPKPIRFYDARFAKLNDYNIADADALVWRYHDTIASTRWSGIGLSFMNEESNIAEDVMLAGMRLGIPVLPVHDSFRVRLQDIPWLEEQMNRSYYNMMGYQPVID